MGLFLATGLAAADPTAADKETARRLMAEGRAHRRSEDWKGALQSFTAADAIMHVPTTGLEVARAQIELGQLVEARDELLGVTRLPADARESRAFSEARATARVLGSEIEGRIPSITVKLLNAPAGSNVKVSVDGVEVPSAALMAPRAVDPGHHVVSARVTGGGHNEASVDVQEGDRKDVTLDVPAGGGADEPPAIPPSVDAEAPPPSQPVNKWRLVTYSGAGVGAAGLIFGSITGLIAISDFSSAKGQGCVNNQCPPAAYPQLDNASTMATLSTVGFIFAALGAGAGAFGFIMERRAGAGATPASSPSSPEGTPSQGSGPTVSLFFGGTSAGLRGSF